MIEPEGLLRHAQQLARTAGGRPSEVAVRRGISAAYYAVFHEVTKRAASHLVGSCPDGIQNEIRRSWSHGEIFQLAAHVIERFAKSHLLEACDNARLARSKLDRASAAAREAFFTLLTVRRGDFRRRSRRSCETWPPSWTMS